MIPEHAAKDQKCICGNKMDFVCFEVFWCPNCGRLLELEYDGPGKEFMTPKKVKKEQSEEPLDCVGVDPNKQSTGKVDLNIRPLHDFVVRMKSKAEGLRFRGQDINQLTREELIVVVAWVVSHEKELVEQHKKDLNSLSGFRRPV